MKYNPTIIEKVEEYQYKKGITFQKTGGILYNNVKIYSIISFVYLFIFQLILSLALWLVPNDNPNYYLQNTVIAFILYIVSFLLSIFKLNILGFIAALFGSVFKLSPLIPLLIINSGVVDIKPVFYWQHLFPIILVFIGTLWLAFISAKEKLIIRRDYKIVLAKIYNQNRDNISSEEDWSILIDEK